MARHTVRVVPHRRRREQRTDFRQRLRLLKSGKPRLVVRKGNNSMLCQLVERTPTGDRTIATASTLSLRKLGWKGHGGNTTAAYLVGYLCGKEAAKKHITEAILDVGLHRTTHGARLFAALKGAVDAGLEIPHDEEIFPPEDRIAGKHVVRYAEQLKKSDQKKYERVFSAYLKAGLPPEQLPKHFAEVKAKVQ